MTANSLMHLLIVLLKFKAMERISTSKAIMKLSERHMAGKQAPFSLGTSLDNDTSWHLEQAKPAPKPQEIKPPAKHLLVLKMEKRLGKPVSLVGPFFLFEDVMNALCSKIKKKLGSGGTCKAEWMEFQGECREKLKTILMAEEFRFKG